MPNLVPDGLSHVFCHGLQEFKADKELEGSLVERFVGRWCEIVLLSQKPTFGGVYISFYFFLSRRNGKGDGPFCEREYSSKARVSWSG